jgi:hypothetical protein
MHADFDRMEDAKDANRYHQRLGAKWMVEAIVRDCRERLRLNKHAQEFANDIERKWEDDAFWRPAPVQRPESESDDAPQVLLAQRDAARDEVKRVRELINRDRTGLAQAVDEIVKEAQGRLWIVEGRGSYEWNDDGYRKETGFALRAVIEIGKKALNDSGKLADSAFHPERERV